MGFVNFNKVNPYKLEFVEPGLFYKHNEKWICLATNCKLQPKYSEDLYHEEPWVKEVLDRLNDTTKLVSNNPYTTFKPVNEDKTNGIQD